MSNYIKVSIPKMKSDGDQLHADIANQARNIFQKNKARLT